MDPETTNEVFDTNPEPVIDTKPKPGKAGPYVVVGIAVVCLLVVFVFIVMRFTTPAEVPVVVEEEPVPVEEPVVKKAEDTTAVEGRDETVLGLRINPSGDRFFTVRSSGMTLYVNTSDAPCEGPCQDAWNPYVTETPLAADAQTSTVPLGESGIFQYTWDGQPLYTYDADRRRGDVLGDGYAGTWIIARP